MDGTVDVDCAVGSDWAPPRCGGDNEVYRSLNAFGNMGFEEEEVTEAPVYRSLDVGLMGVPSGSPGTLPAARAHASASVEDADSSWLAGKRPPLLKRQRACSNLFAPPEL